ncbi:hypothetical protein EV14_1501 [Prochlorococcus sp. MIT 0703]|nr:hypothetical protein EV14_1501 [Prochlorococcus sp. MIT 0703]
MNIALSPFASGGSKSQSRYGSWCEAGCALRRRVIAQSPLSQR